jgi:hypothetical protein
MRPSLWRRVLLWCRQTFMSGAAQMSEKPEPADFELTKYGHDRGHELELNKFTHTLEMEQLKLLILLNGGAATALIAFADEVGIRGDLVTLLAPVLLWLCGLGAGAWATMTMREAQSKYAQAYRFRRNATEWRQLAERFGPHVLGERLGELDPDTVTAAEQELIDRRATRKARELLNWPSDPPAAGGAALRDAAAIVAFRAAGKANGRIEGLSLVSLALFVLGVLAAAGSVADMPAPQAPAVKVEPR